MTCVRKLVAGWIGGLVAAAVLCGAAPAPDLATQVKAAFLVKFPQFIEWPPETFKASTDPLVVGILGEDPFGPAFDQAVQGQKVNGRAIVIRRFRTLKEWKPCPILFISPSEKERLPEILKALAGAAVLTVGDEEQFARHGGMINFIKEGGKVRFEINLEAARRAGLKVRAQLLQVSKVVRS